jgi:hypothetical protein
VGADATGVEREGKVESHVGTGLTGHCTRVRYGSPGEKAARMQFVI